VATDAASEGHAPRAHRPVFWRELDAWVDTPVLEQGDLVCDRVMEGPVVVEYPHTTVVARPGQRLWLETTGNLILDLEKESA
jgi:N-methylhydantoinase A